MENVKNKPLFAVIPPEQTGGVPIKIWATEIDEATGKRYPSVDAGTLLQASMAARLPCAYRHVALMPDAHAGYGLPVGGVFASVGAILPYFVGVDIGCGMCSLNTGIHIDEIDVPTLMEYWHKHIPTGTSSRSNSDLWLRTAPSQFALDKFKENHASVQDKHNIKLPEAGRACTQIGTLGGGNHFVELQTDPEGIAHIMIHSGSRGFGYGVCTMFHDIAKDLCSKWHVKLESDKCAFLPTDTNEGKAYIDSMNLALDYAYQNRSAMMRCAISGIEQQSLRPNAIKNTINIHHNYAALENHFGKNVWVHRKGATLARKNTVGIIPGSMCSTSYIVNGKGCAESFSSCSHGAGRNFSRKKAKQMVEESDVQSQKDQLNTAGVSLYGATDVHDELGHAYKDISTVMANQTDLIDISVELKPVAVLKG